MLSEPKPLVLGELHPLPVVISGRVLLAELHAPWLTGCALGRRDVCLEFHRVGSCIRYCVNESVGQAKAAIMRLRYFADYEATQDGIEVAFLPLEARSKTERRHQTTSAMVRSTIERDTEPRAA